MSFESLGIKEPVLSALRAYGYEAPTPIQEQAIPPALSGRDVLGCAQTGTGKTCAFGAPIIQQLSGRSGSGIRCLILTPTRELAIQIEENLKGYCKGSGIRSAVIFGGVGQAPQVEAIRRGIDILTATPGRLMDLHQQKLLDLSKIEIFVLDEADRMLDMGFIHDVKKIVALLPKKKQTLFFSATMPEEITELVNSLLHDPVRVAVDPVSSPVEVITQAVYFVDRKNKSKLLAKIVREESVKNALVFTRTKHGADKVTRELAREGIEAAAIHGNKSQTARQAALENFKKGTIQVLVATDIAARGLDIEELSHVFNYNLPEVPETYIHRIGRTGRAGHGGTAISFVEYAEQPLLKAVEKLMGKKVPVVEDHPFPMEVFEALKRDAKGRIVNADDEEARAAARERRNERNQTAGQSKKTAAPKQAAGQGKKTAAVKTQVPKKMQAGAEPVVNLPRRNPLEGDVIMDATARLLAGRSGSAAQSSSRSSNRGDNRSRNQRDKKPAQGSENRQTRRDKSPAEPVQAKSAIPAPPQNRRGKGKEASVLSPKGEARGRNGRRKAPPVEAPRSHQKDSTEQPSLMKPFYLDHD